MSDTSWFSEIEATLAELLALVQGELRRAEQQTQGLTALDAEAAFGYARARGTFTAALAAGNARLVDQVRSACHALAIPVFDPVQIERRQPGAGQRLTAQLRALAEASATLRRRDHLNVQLATRARACVTAWLRALTGSPAAYDRQGAARELPTFSTAGRVA